MERLYTNFNDIMLKEMKKVVDGCNTNGTIISEIKLVNDSVDNIKILKPDRAEGLISVELKVIVDK